MFARNLRRRRKPLTALILGAWLFALFVGVANACSLSAPHSFGQPSHGTTTSTECDDSAPQPSANCLQFCADDMPVFSKLQLVHEQPTGKVFLASSPSLAAEASAFEVSIARLAHPRADVPVLRISQRLAL